MNEHSSTKSSRLKAWWRRIADTDKAFRWVFASFFMSFISFCMGAFGFYTDFSAMIRQITQPKQEFIIDIVEHGSTGLNMDLKQYTDLQGRIKFLFDGQEIGFGALSHLQIIFKNSSEKIINKESFANPISIQFIPQNKPNNGQKVLYPKIYSASNEYLRDNITLNSIDGSNISISPVILEPQDWFIVSMLVFNVNYPYSHLGVTGKIAGFERFSIYRHNSIYDTDFQSKSFSTSKGKLGQLNQLRYVVIFILALLSFGLLLNGFRLIGRRSAARTMAQVVIGISGPWKTIAQYYLDYGVEFFTCAYLSLQRTAISEFLKTIQSNCVSIIYSNSDIGQLKKARAIDKLKHMLDEIHNNTSQSNKDLVNAIEKMSNHLKYSDEGHIFASYEAELRNIAQYSMDLRSYTPSSSELNSTV